MKKKRVASSEWRSYSLLAIGYSLRGLLLGRGTAFQHAHDIGLLHDQEILAVDLDLGARPFAEQHEVAGLDVGDDALAVVVEGARADRDHFAFLRLLLGGFRDDDPSGRLL